MIYFFEVLFLGIASESWPKASFLNRNTKETHHVEHPNFGYPVSRNRVTPVLVRQALFDPDRRRGGAGLPTV